MHHIYIHMRNYRKYLLRQLGLKESQFLPNPPKTDDFPGIDPMDFMSPTARPTPIIGVSIRGSSTGGLPSGADQQGDISPTNLGGYDRVEPEGLNSKLVDKTPVNPQINQEQTPIVDAPQTNNTITHPHQIQRTANEEPQATTGASTDSDPTLKLKSAEPETIDVDIAQGGDEEEEIERTDDHPSSKLPTTALSETFERHKKLMREKLGLTESSCICGSPDCMCSCKSTGDACHCGHEGAKMNDIPECATCGCGKLNTTHDMKETEEKDKQLDESKHKPGCQCGFCKNKGNFGKKKKEVEEGEDEDNQKDSPDFKEKDERQFRKDRSASKEGDAVRADFDKDKKEKMDEQQRIDESYAAPFQRMRGLAGLGNVVLTSNGLWENVGASEPFNTHWKMDKEKAGYVKIDEEKLKRIKMTLDRKSKRGTLSNKEMELKKRLDEVLKKRQKNGAINPAYAAKSLQQNLKKGIIKRSDIRKLGVDVKEETQSGKVDPYWKKNPSVTTGGKPYFWSAHNDRGRPIYWVVWDRVYKKWVVQDSSQKLIAKFDSDSQGKKYVEYLLNNKPEDYVRCEPIHLIGQDKP